MRSTVRLLLILFLGLLILLNYNSIRILNAALSFLNKDLEQRTQLIARQISSALSERIISFGPDRKATEEFLRAQMDVYDIQGIVLAAPQGEMDLTIFKRSGMEAFRNSEILTRKLKNNRAGNYLVISQPVTVPGNERKLFLLFSLEEVLKIDREFYQNCQLH